MAPESRKERRRKRKKSQREEGIDEDTPNTQHAKKLDQGKPKDKKRQKKSSKKEHDPYSRFDDATAAALRKDDEEIAALEAKMGLGSSKEKKKLHKEYAKLNCYGDDFGSFLDEVDTMVQRVVAADEEDDDYAAYKEKYGLGQQDSESDEDGFKYPTPLLNDSDTDDDGDNDEAVPMKNCASEDEMVQYHLDREERCSSDDENDGDINEGKNDANVEDYRDEKNVDGMDRGPSDNDDDDDDDAPKDSDGDDSDNEPDHDIKDTYRPSKGEDIYGNSLGKKDLGPSPKKYVPPHLRKKQQEQDGISKEEEQSRQADEAKQKEIRRLLNNSLNRLSENTMISVAQAVSALYPSYPTATVNESIWKNLQIACIERPHLMTGLIPVYVACLSGVHVQVGDSAQLGEYLLERTVTDLWNELKKNQSAHGEDDIIQKDASNLMLVLCYLYNYGIVHCSFIYSVIRSFIESFREMEVELLLLILSHCGRSLRSDDPTALKEIVLLVQKRALEIQKGKDDTAALSSRVEYMIAAMMDLKNNKKRKADAVHADKISKLRKLLGQIKSSHASRSSDSLRIGLDDILNVATKGRWWKVGASWVGNQYRFSEEGNDILPSSTNRNAKDQQQPSLDSKEDAKLLKLAAKARMNTDAKRAIFCIIMKSADCEDAFEKLSRAGHMKNRKERDAVRVLMECCGNEKSYNPFYAHLAARMCDYQPQCKFSMQLAYWDVFKQFEDTVSVRKAANLAKLLFHLVVIHPSIKLGVLKALDMSSPDELSESAVIFLTIFFSNLLEYFDTASDLKLFLEGEVKKKKGRHHGGGGFDADEDDANDMIGGGSETMTFDDNDYEDDGGLGPSISIFLLQTLKASPKYKKGSKFKLHLKAAVKACDTEDFFF